MEFIHETTKLYPLFRYNVIRIEIYWQTDLNQFIRVFVRKLQYNPLVGLRFNMYCLGALLVVPYLYNKTGESILILILLFRFAKRRIKEPDHLDKSNHSGKP